MRRKIPPFSKIALRIFITIFALSLILFNGDGEFMKPSTAKAAGPTIDFTKDNPGIKKAIEVQSRHSETLMEIPGIVGHGIGISSDGKPIIKIFVERAGIPDIPSVLEDIPTRIEVTGKVIAYADPTARFERPVPIGVSTGHPDITAGTIGCRVTDGSSVYALSNNHVYANENDAISGDSALQPGPYDGGQDSVDVIGTLYDFEPIDFSGGDNYIDAAIALSSYAELNTATPDDGYGTPNSTTVEASLEQSVQKYGRTTGWTHGSVDTINTIVDVCYETTGFIFPRCVKEARFVDQIGITPGTFSAGGDSGSLIVTNDENKNPVGLLFAGSNTHTFANPIGPVLDRFKVSVDDNVTTSPENDPPTADFSYTTDKLTATFTDNSIDSDGSVEAWAWDFGDSTTSTDQNPSHTYTAGKTYTVTLTVTDDEGASGSVSQDVTVTDENNTINLVATGYKVKGRHHVDLEWSGTTSNVDIYRDSELIVSGYDKTSYTDSTNNVGGGSYTYQVCEEGTETCSKKVTVEF